MHQAALRHRVREYRAQAVGQPRHAVHAHEQHVLDAALAQLVEHAHPVVRALGLLHPQPEHVLAPGQVVGDYRVDRHAARAAPAPHRHVC